MERSLLTQAEDLAIEHEAVTDGSILQTIGHIELAKVMRAAGATEATVTRMTQPIMIHRSDESSKDSPTPSPSLPPPARRTSNDTVIAQLEDLRSGEYSRVKAILDRETPLDALLIPQMIKLLAWNEIYPLVLPPLRAQVDTIVGQLVDTLENTDESFAIRRRIPRILANSDRKPAIQGLVDGLTDRRFEVRFQCGNALTKFRHRTPTHRFERPIIYDAILREVAVDKGVWKTQRLLDETENDDSENLVTAFIRDRSNRSLEHVFRLISLVHAPEPLRVAFHGLHTDDKHLRGTALEYLESVLPVDIRQKLWPFIEEDPSAIRASEKSHDEIVADLLKSNQSIQLSLEELRHAQEK